MFHGFAKVNNDKSRVCLDHPRCHGATYIFAWLTCTFEVEVGESCG